MKLKLSQLKQIIKEEVARSLNEAPVKSKINYDNAEIKKLKKENPKLSDEDLLRELNDQHPLTWQGVGGEYYVFIARDLYGHGVPDLDKAVAGPFESELDVSAYLDGAGLGEASYESHSMDEARQRPATCTDWNPCGKCEDCEWQKEVEKQEADEWARQQDEESEEGTALTGKEIKKDLEGRLRVLNGVLGRLSTHDSSYQDISASAKAIAGLLDLIQKNEKKMGL